MNTSGLITDWERIGILIFSMFLAFMIILAREFLVNRYLISLGSKDNWWNPIRQKPPPGQYAIMKKNNKDGDFAKIIHSVLGHHLDKDNNFIKDDEDPGYTPPKLGWLDKRLEKNGLVWVSFNRAYYRQPIKYTAWEVLETPAQKSEQSSEEKEKSGSPPEMGPVTKERNVTAGDPYYFFQYTNILVHIVKADVKDSLPVDMKLLITLRHHNPYKVHFLTGKWVIRGVSLVQRVVREIVSAKVWDEVRSMSEKNLDEITVKIQEAVDSGDLHKPPAQRLTFTQKYGLEFDDPELITIDPVVDPQLKSAMTAAAEAKMRLEAADAANGLKLKNADGDAESIKRVYEAVNSVPNGPFMFFAQAVRDGKLEVLVMGENQGVSIPVPPRKP